MSSGTGERDGLPTGRGTSPDPVREVSDPHPSDEDGTGEMPRPGGTVKPKSPDIGPNDAVHDGHAPPKPRYDRPGEAR